MKRFPNGSGNPAEEETARMLHCFIENCLKFGKEFDEFEKNLVFLRSIPKVEKIVENIVKGSLKNLNVEDFESITKDGSILMVYGSTFLEHGSEQGIIDFLNLALQIFRKCRNYFKKNEPNYANTLLHEGNARRDLAWLGVDSVENLRKAIELYQRAREEGFTKNTSDFAKALMHEGNARRDLGRLGVDSVENLRKAIKLYQRAREEGLVENTEDYARALMNEGAARDILAERGVDSVENLRKAIKLYQRAREEGFIENTQQYAEALKNEGVALDILAVFGVNSVENLRKAIKLCQRAREEGLVKNTPQYGEALMNEAGANFYLAVFGVDSVENLRKAIKLYQISREEGLVKNTPDYAKALMNEGVARSNLAVFGVNSVENLRKAIKLCERTRNEGFDKNTSQYGWALMNEGVARSNLAGLGVDSVENLRKAIKLCQRAREEGLTENTQQYAEALMYEGEARKDLAGLSVDSVENLRKAIKLCQRARAEGFTENTLDYAYTLMYEGEARKDLAGLSVDSAENLRKAIKLCQRAREEGFNENTPDYAKTLMIEGLTKVHLAELGIQEYENFGDAIKLYEDSRTVFKATSDKIDLISVNRYIGDLKYFTSDFLGSYQYLGESVDLIEGIRSAMKVPELRKDYFETVVDIYKKMVFTCLALVRNEEAFSYAETAKGRTFLELLASEKKKIRGDPELIERYREVLMNIDEIQGKLLMEKRGANIDEYDKLKELGELQSSLLIQIKNSDPEFYSVEKVEPVTIEELRNLLKGRILVEYFLGSDKVAIFILKDELIVKVLEVYEKEIWEKVNEFLEIMRRMELKFGLYLEIEKEIREADSLLRDFYKLLIEPIESYLGYAEEGGVVFVPHSYLHYIPFLALKDGDGRYLNEKFRACFVQSASSLKFLKGGGGTGALVVGNPTEDLSFGKEEALETAKLLGVQPLLGKDARKEVILGEILGKKVIHFSCHGEFDPFRPSHSRVLLAEGSSITAVEFMDLDLDAELMVLSACETARAKVGRGDEVEGLVRAIQFGGCRFIIASQWMVADKSTKELFSEFYKEEGDIIDRLRKAQLSLMKDYNFFHWAPFQVYGF